MKRAVVSSARAGRSHTERDIDHVSPYGSVYRLTETLDRAITYSVSLVIFFLHQKISLSPTQRRFPRLPALEYQVLMNRNCPATPPHLPPIVIGRSG